MRNGEIDKNDMFLVSMLSSLNSLQVFYNMNWSENSV